MSGTGKHRFHQVPDFFPVVGADQQLFSGSEVKHIALHAPDTRELDDVRPVNADKHPGRQYFEQFFNGQMRNNVPVVQKNTQIIAQRFHILDLGKKYLFNSFIGFEIGKTGISNGLRLRSGGNGGGNTSTSDEMARLIYTNAITYPAWDFRSSEEYIRSAEKDLKSEKDTTNPFYARSQRLLKAVKNNPGKLVNDGEDLQRTYGIDPKAYPQHIAFLMDKGCGSATEFFIYEGKQSKKVTLFGTNSHGVMDYGADQTLDLCDGTFSVAIPWGRNGWVREFRIDNVGFAPDVRIPENEKDWVAFVQRYYAKRDKEGK
jgi:hypothetical protein